METSTNRPVQRLHPLVATAAASGDHRKPTGRWCDHWSVSVVTQQSNAGRHDANDHLTSCRLSDAGPPAIPNAQPATSVPLQATPTRFQTADGRVFEEVPSSAMQPSVTRVPEYLVPRLEEPAPVIHRKVVHHYTQSARHVPSYRDPDYRDSANREPAYVRERPYYAHHPVQTYISDMNPIGTGIGAVVGGVLGNQIGGGNGKKLATVAGVLLGGYAGNEVAHDRNPLPFGNR